MLAERERWVSIRPTAHTGSRTGAPARHRLVVERLVRRACCDANSREQALLELDGMIALAARPRRYLDQ